MASRAQPARKRTDVRKGVTPVLEWLLGVVGAALLAAGAAFLVYEGLTRSDRPGPIEIRTIDVSPAGDAFVARSALHNTGDRPLSNLRVTARLRQGEQEVEAASVTLDYLPAHSTREVGFYLRRDPRRYTFEVAPEGYQEP